jgi:hypothetical protein
MSSLDKQMAMLKRLVDEKALPTGVNRIEFKAVKSGHFRLYLAIPGKCDRDAVTKCEALADEHSLYLSPFPHPSAATALTFIDPDEQA